MQIDFVEGSALWSNLADTQEWNAIAHYSLFLIPYSFFKW